MRKAAFLIVALLMLCTEGAVGSQQEEILGCWKLKPGESERIVTNMVAKFEEERGTLTAQRKAEIYALSENMHMQTCFYDDGTAFGEFVISREYASVVKGRWIMRDTNIVTDFTDQDGKKINYKFLFKDRTIHISAMEMGSVGEYNANQWFEMQKMSSFEYATYNSIIGQISRGAGVNVSALSIIFLLILFAGAWMFFSLKK